MSNANISTDFIEMAPPPTIVLTVLEHFCKSGKNGVSNRFDIRIENRAEIGNVNQITKFKIPDNVNYLG